MKIYFSVFCKNDLVLINKQVLRGILNNYVSIYNENGPKKRVKNRIPKGAAIAFFELVNSEGEFPKPKVIKEKIYSDQRDICKSYRFFLNKENFPDDIDISEALDYFVRNRILSEGIDKSYYSRGDIDGKEDRRLYYQFDPLATGVDIFHDFDDLVDEYGNKDDKRREQVLYKLIDNFFDDDETKFLLNSICQQNSETDNGFNQKVTEEIQEIKRLYAYLKDKLYPKPEETDCHPRIKTCFGGESILGNDEYQLPNVTQGRNYVLIRRDFLRSITESLSHDDANGSDNAKMLLYLFQELDSVYYNEISSKKAIHLPDKLIKNAIKSLEDEELIERLYYLSTGHEYKPSNEFRFHDNYSEYCHHDEGDDGDTILDILAILEMFHRKYDISPEKYRALYYEEIDDIKSQHEKIENLYKEEEDICRSILAGDLSDEMKDYLELKLELNDMSMSDLSDIAKKFFDTNPKEIKENIKKNLLEESDYEIDPDTYQAYWVRMELRNIFRKNGDIPLFEAVEKLPEPYNSLPLSYLRYCLGLS